jgi:hypothetical protein
MTKTTDITNLLVNYVLECGEASSYLQTYYDMDGYVIDKIYNFTRFKLDCLNVNVIKENIAQTLGMHIDNIGNINELNSENLNKLITDINEAQGIYENDINIITDYNETKLRELVYHECSKIIAKLDYLETKDNINVNTTEFVLNYSFELIVLLIIICVTGFIISILSYQSYKKLKSKNNIIKEQLKQPKQPKQPEHIERMLQEMNTA